MRLRILDACVIELGGREYTPSSTQFFALLLRLGADAGRHFQRRELADLFFPAAPSGRAGLHSARQLIYQAAQRGVEFEKVNGAVGIRTGSVSIDMDEALTQDHGIDRRTYRTLSVLPGYAPHISQAFDDWLDAFREHTTSRLKHALLDSLDGLRKRADWRAVEVRAKECLTLDPFSEPATLALAEALARTGSKDRAVATLEAYRSEVGSRDAQIAVPAALLRKRIEIGERRSTYDAAVPLIGRGDEIAALHDQSAKARTGAVQFTLIRGEPGSGKSRLIDEFQSMTAYSGESSIALVRKTVADKFRPLALFADLVPLLLKLPGAAGCDPNLLPFLTRLTDALYTPKERLTPGEAEYLSSGITRAIVDLLDSLSSERACLILVDDSRAIDEVSLALLRDLANASSPLRVHVVVACAESEHRDVLSQLQTRTLVLKPLSRASARELLVAALASVGRIVGDDLIAWCTTVAAGNPAFLRLLGGHIMAASAPQAIPLDIVAAVNNRLASLATEALRILEACAVLGDECEPLIVGEVLGIQPLALIGGLHDLETGGFVDFTGERILLRSELFRDRVIASASPAVVSFLHARSAVALQSQSGSASPWRIASHWRSAGQHQKARTTLTASWRKSLQLGQSRQAEASLRDYLALTVDSTERIALYGDLIEVLQAAGDYGAIVLAIDERCALVGASHLPDARHEAFAFDRVEAQLRNMSDPTIHEEQLLGAMRSVTLDAGRRLRASTQLLIAADTSAAAALAEQVYAALPSLAVGTSLERAQLNQSLLIYHSVFGSKNDALSLAAQMISDAQLAPTSWTHIQARMNAAIGLQLAEPRKALVDLEQLYQQLLSAGTLNLCVQLASRLATIALDVGDVDLATYWMRMGDSHASGVINVPQTPDYLAVRTDLYLLAGDSERARKVIATMRDTVPLYKSPRYQMSLLIYSLRLAHLEDSPIEETSVNDLVDFHLRFQPYGRHDDAMESVWVSLVSIGKRALASHLLADYLTHFRRELGPCSYLLRMRTASDPAWSTLNDV